MDQGQTLYVRLAAHLGDLRGDLARGAGMVQAYGQKVDAQMASMQQYAKKNQAELRSLGNVAGGVGLVAAAGLAVAVSKFMEFDKQMSAVQAATHSSKAEMAALRSEAIQLGADTKFSATEAAQGIEELAKAGVSTQEILNGALKGSLDLAAAGDLSVAQAAEIAATAKTQFDLMGSDIPHLADLLAAGAGKAQGSVTDLGAALGQTGLVAAGMGLSIEDTTGTLAAFASAGLIGSDAGTSFKTMIQRLQAPMGRGAKAMAEYGISAYDAQGNFVGITDVAGQLQDKLGGLSQETRDAALAQIFGSDAIRAATVLYKQGEKGISGWIAKTNDAGYAAETARLRTDNLAGDIERLGGSLDSLLIGMGAGANGPGREFVQMLEGIVDLAGAVPAPIMAAAVAALALTAAFGLTVFAATRMIGAVGATRANLALLKAQTISTAESLYLLDRAALLKNIAKGAAVMGGVALASGALGDSFALSNTAAFALMGTMAGPMGVATGTAVGFLMDVKAASSDMSSEFKAAMKDLEQAPDISGQLQALESMEKARKSVLNDSMNPVEAFSVGLKALTGQGNVFDEQRKEIEKATKAVQVYKGNVATLLSSTYDAEANKFFSKDYSVKELQDFADEVTPILKRAGLDAKKVFAEGVNGENYSAATAAINEYRYSTETAAGRQELLDSALANVDNALVGTTVSVKDLASALKGVFSPEMDFDAAVQKYRDGLAAMRGELEKNGAAVDNDTVKGRANRAVIREQISALNDQVIAAASTGASSEYLANMMARGREQILGQADAAGVNKQAMSDLLEQYNLTPEMISTIVKAEGVPEAQGQVADLTVDLSSLGRMFVTPTIDLKTGGAAGVIAGIAVGLNALNGKKVTTTILTKRKTLTEIAGELDAYGSYKPGTGGRGAIVPRYARGLYNDAQIVRAGAPRAIWGEPETQGESFIPHAMDRRGRSTEILGKTAAKFGYDLSPRGRQSAGRGGGTTVQHFYEGALVESVSFGAASAREARPMITDLTYELRRVRRGGKYNR